MSKPVKRWEPENTVVGFNMRPTPDGDFVLYQHYQELEAERNELLGLLRDVRDPVCEALNGASNERADLIYRELLARIDAALAKRPQGKEGE